RGSSQRPQSSSASRFTAGASEFFILSQSGERPQPAGRGAEMIRLLGRSALQLIENQFAMLLEYAQRPLEHLERRLSNLRGVARILRMLGDDALASDVGPQFGNVPVGLDKMTANHRIEG